MGTSRTHWDAVYTGKADEDLSWHEDSAAESLRLILDACPAPP
jgi:hypothetical protein